MSTTIIVQVFKTNHLIVYSGLPVPLFVCENKNGAVVALIRPEPLFAPSERPMNCEFPMEIGFPGG